MAVIRGLSDRELDRLIAAAEAAFAAAITRAFKAATANLVASNRALSASLKPVGGPGVDDVAIAMQMWVAEVPELTSYIGAAYGQSATSVGAALYAESGLSIPDSPNPSLTPIGLDAAVITHAGQGVPVVGRMAIDRAARDHLASAANRLVNAGDAMWMDIRSQLTEGFTAGEGIRDLTSRLRGTADVSRRRAETIARTEVIGASNAGAMAGARAIPEIAPATKTWLATGDGRTRPSHREADGQIVGLDEPFEVGGYQMDFPGGDGPAEEVINCFPGDAPVRWVGDLQHVTRRWYAGDGVEVVTADGVTLTATPNHPLLTPRGWVAAGSLGQGDRLFNVRSFNGAPEVDDPPPRIEQVYRAASQAGRTVRRRGRRVDFHGDGADGEVEVVDPHGDLLGVLHPHRVKLGGNDQFVRLEGRPGLLFGGGDAGVPLAGGVRVEVPRPVAERFVRSGSQSATLLGAHPRHPQPVGFAAGPLRQATATEVSGDRGAADVVVVGQGEDAQALVVEPVEVVAVRRIPLCCHVYNLQSSTGIILYNGRLVTHNCRCTVTFGDPAEAVQAVEAGDPDMSDTAAAARRGRAAETWGVSPEQLSASIPDVARLRAAVRGEAARVQEDALRWLDNADALRIQRRPRGYTGREYDWMDQLHPAERSRIQRGWTDNADFNAPDIVMHRAVETGLFRGESLDGFMEEWLAQTRRADAAGALRRGRLPVPSRLGGVTAEDITTVLSEQGLDIRQILAIDVEDAAGYLAQTQSAQYADEAMALLGPSTGAELPPWRMSFQAWEDEVRGLETSISEGDLVGQSTAEMARRHAELVPPRLDVGQEFEALYADVVGAARVAGMDVADWAVIPWSVP